MKPALHLAVLLVAVTAGCVGGPVPGLGDASTASPAADGGAADCRTGESYDWVDPRSGERVSMDVQGRVEHEGRRVCKAVWETNSPDAGYSRVVVYYAGDGSYQKVVYYDAEGNVVGEMEAENPGTAGASGGEATAGGWCVEGRTASFADPRTGERASMEVKGTVEREGRVVCKSVYETNSSDAGYSRVVMYETENGNYQRIVYYDAEGNVVEEFEVGGTPTTTG